MEDGSVFTQVSHWECLGVKVTVQYPDPSMFLSVEEVEVGSSVQRAVLL